MKSWFTTIVMVLGFLLCTGCSMLSSITPEQVAEKVRGICGIEAALADLAALISKDPAIKTIDGYAKLVCQAYVSHSQVQATRPGAEAAAASAGVLTVEGVPIHYKKA